MSNIDERVVRMEFDNKAFEKNASETMSTLDKLKSVLNFDNVKGSFAKITDAAKKVDVSNVSDGIETVNAKLSTMQIVGATAISRVTNSLMSFGKRIVGGTFGQIVQGGINRAFNIEQAKFTIEGLGKDFVKLKEDINYAVSGTAYGFDEAAKAASMMSASGIEAGEEMKASLRGISGMAAMTGASYSEIADIFGNMAGKGKVSAQELNRFAVRGINVAAALADAMDTDEETIHNMVRKSEIDFKTFAMTMDNVFGEHATEANKTFTGVMMNIKASLSRIGEAFIHPLMETNERDALILQTYDKVDNRLIDIAQNSRKAFESGVNARASLNNAIRESNRLAGLTDEQIRALVDNRKKGFINYSKDIPKYAKMSEEELKKIYDKDQKALEKQLKKTPEYANMTREELQGILASEKRMFIEEARGLEEYSALTDKELGKLYDNYTGFQYNITTVLQAFKRVLGVIESSINNSSFLSVFLDKMKKVSEAATLLFNAIAATFSGGVLTVSELVNGETKEYVVKASKLWESFRKALGLTKADMANLEGTIKGISSVFKLFGDIISAVWKSFSPLLGLFKTAGSIIFLITGTIGRFLDTVYKIINATQIIQNTATVINTILSGVVDTINFVVDGIVTALTFLTNNPATKGLVNILVKAAGSINMVFQALFAAFGGIAGLVQFVVQTIQNEFSKIPDNPIFSKILKTLNRIGNSFNKIFTTIADTADTAIRSFLLPFKNFGKISLDVGGTVDSVLSLINDGLNTFAGFLEKCSKRLDSFID